MTGGKRGLWLVGISLSRGVRAAVGVGAADDQNTEGACHAAPNDPAEIDRAANRATEAGDEASVLDVCDDRQSAHPGRSPQLHWI